MIIAIVPAAGLSRRMGTAKQLLPFAGTTVIGHIVDTLSRSLIDEVCVVVGHQADRLSDALDARRVRLVVNPDYERTEMLASIRCGLAAVAAGVDAILIALGDQPAITVNLIDTMIGVFTTGNRGIIVPVHAGRRGHPLLLAGRYRDEILTGYDNVGLRGLLAARSHDVCEFPVSTAAILSEMNYPEDYQRELARLNQTQGGEP